MKKLFLGTVEFQIYFNFLLAFFVDRYKIFKTPILSSPKTKKYARKFICQPSQQNQL